MATTSPTSTSLVAPVQQGERIQIVDILRGFALFGILLVNMIIFARPFQSILLPLEPGLPWFERAAEWLIHFLGEGKFYSLFSMLFGLGLTLQMERIEAKGGRFVPLYMRRLLVLLGIGLVHAFLIWVGDILIMYAVIGFILILFRKAKPRTLMIWIVILIAIPIVFNLASTGLVSLANAFPEGAAQIEEAMQITGDTYRADVATAARIYATGNFFEITARRYYDYTSMGFISFFVLGFNVLAMFLLGVFIGRRGLFRDLAGNRPVFKKLLLWGLIVGGIGNFVYATLIMDIARYEPTWRLAIATISQAVGAPMLMLAYVSAICLLAGRPGVGERLKVLAPVGQMALSNYLTQSIVCTLLFYGYGFGLFGKVGAAAGIGITIILYLLQVPFSNWWRKRFNYGPAEWVWRSLTYKRAQPIKATS